MLDDYYFNNQNVNTIYDAYINLNKLLREDYKNLSEATSNFNYYYALSKGEKLNKNNFNPFDYEELHQPGGDRVDAIAASCLWESIEANRLPSWGVELVDLRRLSHVRDDLERSHDRGLITKGLIIIDPILRTPRVGERFLYAPICIVEIERFWKQLEKSNTINMYKYDNSYKYTISISYEFRQKIAKMKGASQYDPFLFGEHLNLSSV